MNKGLVPLAPTGNWPEREKDNPGGLGQIEPARSAASMSQALDAAFLCRLQLSALWFGAFCTLLVAGGTPTLGGRPALSYGAGVLLGMALIASQAFLVGRTLRPTRPGESKKEAHKRLAWWLLLPVKYLAVALLLGAGIRNGWVQAPWLGAGFICVQFVLGAKVVGYVLSRQMKSVREAYIAPQPARDKKMWEAQ
jgi:hypothetical protein